jgi:hypothetical protein
MKSTAHQNYDVDNDSESDMDSFESLLNDKWEGVQEISFSLLVSIFSETVQFGYLLVTLNYLKGNKNLCT